MAADDTTNDGKPKARCPICKAPTELTFRPFCSRRCADVDLSRWLRGSYAIAAQDDDDDEDGDAAAGMPDGNPDPNGKRRPH